MKRGEKRKRHLRQKEQQVRRLKSGFLFLNFYLFIYFLPHRVACGILVHPKQGLNPGNGSESAKS